MNLIISSFCQRFFWHSNIFKHSSPLPGSPEFQELTTSNTDSDVKCEEMDNNSVGRRRCIFIPLKWVLSSTDPPKAQCFAKQLLLFLIEWLDVREGPRHVLVLGDWTFTNAMNSWLLATWTLGPSNHNGWGPLVLRLAETFVTGRAEMVPRESYRDWRWPQHSLWMMAVDRNVDGGTIKHDKALCPSRLGWVIGS